MLDVDDLRFDLASLRAAQIRAGFTQRGLAAKLRLAETDLSAIAHGRKPLSVEVARAIAAELDVELESIIEHEPSRRRAGGTR